MNDSTRQPPDDKDKKDSKKPSYKRQDAFLNLTDFFGVNLKPAFKFKESTYPYDYINVLRQVGLKQMGTYTIVRMGEHLQFHSRKEVIEPKPTNSDDIKNRMQMFKTKKPETDSIGWKLHISVAPEDIEKAWSLICPILMKHEVSGFKIIHPDVLESAFRKNNLDHIANKQFTIYQFRNPQFDTQKWEAVIKEIDEVLQKNDIKPSQTPDVDKKIEDSHYFSYRNDKHPTQAATSIDAIDVKALVAQSADKTLQTYNPSKSSDPFEEVKPFAENKKDIKR